MGSSDEAIALLRSIDASLKLLVKQQRTHVAADDRDLDSPHGNPEVKFNPRDWAGPSFKGCRMSECDPTFLLMLADTFDYFADKAEENDERTSTNKPVAPYKRKDAARARGWAKRIQDGKVPATTAASPNWGTREPGDEDGF